MEKPLLASAMRSRQDYNLIQSYIDVKQASYSTEFKVVMGKVGDYYARDQEIQDVSGEVLIAQIRETVRSEKLANRLADLIGESLAETSSDANVRIVVLAAKQQEVADKLAAALTTDGAGQSDRVDSLIAELNDLRAMTDLSEIHERGLEIYENVDLEALMTQEYDPENIIKLYPEAVNQRLDGGLHKGNHVVVFARPDAGKSMFAINASAGFARQGKRVLYLINEDRPTDIIIRHVANLSSMTKHEIRDNPKKAEEIARNHGWDNVIIMSAAPGTPDQIRHYISKYDPDCIIVDQLRNLAVKADGRTNQLEAAATAIRNIANKEANIVALSVTQAGDSADKKLILEMGDVDYSNTGIPAQADVMIGIGVDDKHEAEGLRIINLPKNKVGGVHEHFPVKVYPSISRITSV